MFSIATFEKPNIVHRIADATFLSYADRLKKQPPGGRKEVTSPAKEPNPQPAEKKLPHRPQTHDYITSQKTTAKTRRRGDAANDDSIARRPPAPRFRRAAATATP